MKLKNLSPDEKKAHKQNYGIKWKNKKKEKDPNFLEKERTCHQKVNNSMIYLMCVNNIFALPEMKNNQDHKK